MEISNYLVVIKRARFSSEAIQGVSLFSGFYIDWRSLAKLSVFLFKTELQCIANQLESSLPTQEVFYQVYNHDRRHYNPGRPTEECLCARISDQKACWLWENIYTKLKSYVMKPIQYISCFFLGLFALLDTEIPDGKVAHYWRLLRKNIKGEKIPSLRTVQDAIRMFSNWKAKTMSWLYTSFHDKKFKAWSALQDMIEKLLPELEPKLAVCII